MSSKILQINLFGACSVGSVAPGKFEITGAKHRALFALLATAPFGRRSRAFLQEVLWGTACYDDGRQSLRRALSDIKHVMGEDYATLLSSNNSELTLNLSLVQFVGQPGIGDFLEGLDLREAGFRNWISGIRQNPGQLAGLYSLASQAPAPPILPVVAILPFRAIGGDSSDGVLGDWLAEEICRSLCRSRLLTVIAHLSCRELARASVDISTVRNLLHADYCVSGSLRRVGNDLVLDADFVDTRSGRILWTRQFVNTVERFISVSGEGIAAIVRAVGGAIADESLEHVLNRPLAEIEDHRLMIAGVTLMHRLILRDFARSRELIEESLRRAPHAAENHAWLGKWYVLCVFNGWSTNIEQDTQRALDCTARALDISPDNAFSLSIDGFAQNNLRLRMDIASQRYEAALAINPNEALSWLLKGVLLAFQDEGEGAITAVRTARRLSPIDPFRYFFDSLSATAFLSNENYEQALELAEASYSLNDRHLSTLRARISALHFLGRNEEARKLGAELLRRQPDYTVSGYLTSHPAAHFNIGQRMAHALLAVGIPQGD